MSGCDLLVVGPTHEPCVTLDQVRVSVVSQIGNLEHLYLPTVISMSQAVPNSRASRKVFLPILNTVRGATQYLLVSKHLIETLLTILLRFLSCTGPYWSDVMYQPRLCTISLHNHDMP